MGTLVVRGATVVLYVNSKVYAEVNSFEFTSNTPAKEIRGIDSTEVLELAATTGSCSGTIGVHRLSGTGGLEGIGVAVRYEDLPAQKYVSLQLVDRSSDTVLFEATKCRIETQGFGVAAKGIMSGKLTFKAISWTNESTRNTNA
jgi:hypothetical protein